MTNDRVIVDPKVIEGLREDVVVNLEKARRSELNARHAFELLAQSLKNEIATFSASLADSQANKVDISIFFYLYTQIPQILFPTT